MDNNKILCELIDLLRSKGVEINNPYDFENWINDNTSHSKLWETGKFEED